MSSLGLRALILHKSRIFLLRRNRLSFFNSIFFYHLIVLGKSFDIKSLIRSRSVDSRKDKRGLGLVAMGTRSQGPTRRVGVEGVDEVGDECVYHAHLS